jgi:hypothetical protein
MNMGKLISGLFNKGLRGLLVNQGTNRVDFLRTCRVEFKDSPRRVEL